MEFFLRLTKITVFNCVYWTWRGLKLGFFRIDYHRYFHGGSLFGLVRHWRAVFGVDIDLFRLGSTCFNAPLPIFFNRNFTSWWLDSFFPLTDRYLVLTDCYRVLLGSIGTGIPSPSGEESRTQFTSEWKVINKVAPPWGEHSISVWVPFHPSSICHRAKKDTRKIL